jgi:aryl-alcohol dehydrogenase-like predicted oxidoreductase
MHTRTTARLKTPVSEIGLGCWQLGSADWGAVSDADAFLVLQNALDHGVTFIDTADVYGAGHSESLIGRFLKALPPSKAHGLFIASKLGRLHGFPDSYTETQFRDDTQASVDRLGRPLDLHQLHCVPPAVLQRGRVFDWLRQLKAEGLIRHFGASVESMDEARTCLQHDDLTSLQIIFNIFRQKPIDELFDLAAQKGVALIVRLPLASGLLAGKYTQATTFPEKDHRHYNRDGKFFNVGETFAGIEFHKAVELTDQIKPLLGVASASPPMNVASPSLPPAVTMADLATRWILDHPAVTTVIPGATKPAHAAANARASDLPPLPPATHQALREFYQRQVKQHIRGPY